MSTLYVKKVFGEAKFHCSYGMGWSRYREFIAIAYLKT